MTAQKRSVRHGVEDRWHRPPRRGEQVNWPADHADGPVWCTDPRHVKTPGTMVCTARHGQGKQWLARWVDHNGKEATRAFDRKVEAKRHSDNERTKIDTGTYADPRKGATLFSTVAEQWFSAKATGVKPKTAASYRSVLDMVVLPKWRDYKLRDIDHAAVQSWVAWLATSPDARNRPKRDGEGKVIEAGLSAARVHHAYQVVDQVLRFAMRSKLIAFNPANDVELPRKTATEKIALTHEQVRQLADASGELATMVYVLGYAGLRYGECAALRVGDVDTTRRRLRVSRSITYVTGSGNVEGTTKTHATRMVPVPQFVADMLAEAIRGRAPGERLFPCDGYDAMPLDYFRWRFNKAAAKVGLSGISPHVLRHTAGSLALASGEVSVTTVQKLLGHQSATTTMNVYTHMLPDDFDNLAAAMDKAVQALANG
ncbi:site-specific integrase [Mycobacterium intracellulare]|uniref:tyrosine-type recombinase/integrase n=1 Tax=Mycobacterium intracellulare TaxID=1767 RepID=UPI001CDB455D|nr:site-specific integrase [Mycobacterium intracellulare]MCA2254806.1 site-specific integrase [Mycobacterium intracellulare]